MPNLVGIGNSQVPTNAMLGGLAYQDPDHAQLKDVEIENITAIKAKTGDTATAVFVYDTRKDSDGGAWRHKCRHTSWYNETLGTEKRGIRREFPAVAVIVALNDMLTIYDADSQDCPMWMQFKGTDTGWTFIQYGSSNLTSVHALNGILCVGSSDGGTSYGNLSIIDFIKENAIQHNNPGVYQYRTVFDERDTIQPGWAVLTEGTTDNNIVTNGIKIVNPYVNSIAMRVLPNAKVDPDRGLPTPTIAVATQGGISVIDDLGYVYDNTTNLYSNNQANHITFNDAGDKIAWMSRGGNIYPFITNIPTGNDVTARQPEDIVVSLDTSSIPNVGHDIKIRNSATFNGLTHTKGNTLAVAGNSNDKGLQLVDYVGVGTDYSGSAGYCMIRSYDTSGWMYGDIKGAYLGAAPEPVSSTANLVTNGNANQGTTGWTNSGGTLSESSGVFSYATTSNQNAYQQVTGLTVGKYYKMTYTHKTGYTSAYIGPNSTSASPNISLGDIVSGSDVTRSGVWKATQTSAYVVVYGIGAATHTFDNVSLVETHDLFGRSGLAQNGGAEGWITGNDSTFGAAIASINWSERSGTSWNVSGGVLKTGTVSSGEYLDITVGNYASGQTVVITYTISNKTGSNPLRWRFNDGQMGDLPSSNGFHVYYVTLTETGTLFSLLNDNSCVCDIDNFTMQVVETDDRSFNKKGLVTWGHIERTPVATGAELLAYGGFSSENYLEQAYNSDLNWQSSDFTVYGWFKLASNNTQECLMMLMQPDGEVDYMLIEQQSNGDMRFQIDLYGGAAVAYATTLPTGVWHHYCGVNRSDSRRPFLYINGVDTGLWNDVSHDLSNPNFDNTTAELTIGRRATASYGDGDSKPFTGQMSLWRISNTAIPPEKIVKMYNDEKKLFAPDAKCTLYGSSQAVEAVGYDDSTEILHAGTSSGRSDFDGLVRINNTTESIGVCISASNGLIVEE
tara:strand:+ start:1120 stop:3987 length:2868 start_codon:yes stop_codon:yes gene_type:complete